METIRNHTWVSTLQIASHPSHTERDNFASSFTGRWKESQHLLNDTHTPDTYLVPFICPYKLIIPMVWLTPFYGKEIRIREVKILLGTCEKKEWGLISSPVHLNPRAYALKLWSIPIENNDLRTRSVSASLNYLRWIMNTMNNNALPRLKSNGWWKLMWCIHRAKPKTWGKSE